MGMAALAEKLNYQTVMSSPSDNQHQPFFSSPFSVHGPHSPLSSAFSAAGLGMAGMAEQLNRHTTMSMNASGPSYDGLNHPAYGRYVAALGQEDVTALAGQLNRQALTSGMSGDGATTHIHGLGYSQMPAAALGSGDSSRQGSAVFGMTPGQVQMAGPDAPRTSGTQASKGKDKQQIGIGEKLSKWGSKIYKNL